MLEEEREERLRLTLVFCPSFDLFHSTLTQEVKGYPVGTAVGVVFFFFVSEYMPGR